MNPSGIQQFLSLTREEWKALPEVSRPWGVWMTLHAPLAANADHILQRRMPLIHGAWFFEDGMALPAERDIWAFTRFWVMHFERPWDEARCASRDPRFSPGRFSLGVAAFAPYADSQDWCLETLWAGLRGQGRRLRLTTEGIIEPVQDLWIS